MHKSIRFRIHMSIHKSIHKGVRNRLARTLFDLQEGYESIS